MVEDVWESGDPPLVRQAGRTRSQGCQASVIGRPSGGGAVEAAAGASGRHPPVGPGGGADGGATGEGI